jgi:hypothetical protein
MIHTGPAQYDGCHEEKQLEFGEIFNASRKHPDAFFEATEEGIKRLEHEEGWRLLSHAT